MMKESLQKYKLHCVTKGHFTFHHEIGNMKVIYRTIKGSFVINGVDITNLISWMEFENYCPYPTYLGGVKCGKETRILKIYTVDLSMMMSFGIGMYLQGLFLVLLKVILLKLRTIITFRENYWCHFFTEIRPF